MAPGVSRLLEQLCYQLSHDLLRELVYWAKKVIRWPAHGSLPSRRSSVIMMQTVEHRKRNDLALMFLFGS